MSRYDLKYCVPWHIMRTTFFFVSSKLYKQSWIFILPIREKIADEMRFHLQSALFRKKSTTRNKMVINIICRNTLYFHLFVWISVWVRSCCVFSLLQRQTRRFCSAVMSQTMRRMKNWSSLDALLLFRFCGRIEAKKRFSWTPDARSLCFDIHTVYISWECGRIIPYEFM